MKLNIKRIILSGIAMLTFVTIVPFATASAAKCNDGSFIFPRWYDNLCGSDGKSIAPPNGTSNKAATSTSTTEKNLTQWIGTIALNLVQMLLYVVGYVSLGYIIYGGFKYMLNGDSSSGTVAARKTIQNAIIGLVLSIMSVAIIKFVAGIVG